MPLVSVVIPIYNAQPYLRQCLDSIRAQTLQDIEVLCVNDGSTDDSLDVLREYAAADARFIVLDKPNGGYGHSMNYGIARATGEFIAIVEPDDFIHPTMYEDLVSFAEFEGAHADVIKGGYWEFFDGRDGYDDMYIKPPLSFGMGETPRSFTLEEDTTVIEHHPSIWSALYRRSFLSDFDISFIEPKGAGWADNPFLMETMICARRIVWVPKEYYYYRQTNPGASSFLKDYHIPFDRARDMDAVLRKRGAARNIWEAFYLREFFYIDSITNEFGFDGRDPELQELITNMVKGMDGEVVLSSKMLPPAMLARYVSIMRFANDGERQQEPAGSLSAEESVEEPLLLTYIIPAARDGKWALGVLDSISQQPIDAFEALIVDCGATDSTLAICRHYSIQDPRFKILQDCEGIDGLNAALASARGIYTYVLTLRKRFVGDAFARALLFAAEHEIDLMLLDTRCRFPVDAMRSMRDDSDFQAIPDGIIVGPLDIQGVSGFALNCSYPYERSSLIKTELLKNPDIRFMENDVFGNGILGARALLSAKQIAYLGSQFLEKRIRERAFTVSTLEMRNWRFEAQILALPAALSLTQDAEIAKRFKESLCNLVAEAFLYDLESRRSPEAIASYFDEHYREAAAIWAQRPKSAQPYDVEVAEGMELLRMQGLQGFLSLKYLSSNIGMKAYRNELSELMNSRMYKLADRLRDVYMNILPKELISRIRGSIASSDMRI